MQSYVENSIFGAKTAILKIIKIEKFFFQKNMKTIFLRHLGEYVCKISCRSDHWFGRGDVTHTHTHTHTHTSQANIGNP